MRLQSILVIVVEEIDVYNENGEFQGTALNQRHVQDLNEAVLVVGQAYRQQQKKGTQNGIQPESPREPATV